jgi:dTDP-4-amino-4,6-dideoxygalactose transaminase
MIVPLLDLKSQYRTIRQEVMAVTEEIFESQYFILGPKVDALEKEIARYCGCAHAVGVSSGTDALLLALMAAGIGVGDRVLTTPYSFFATAGSITRVGAVPIFADIDPDTFNISPGEIESVLSRLSPGERKKVKAIIPVHLYGQCADMDPILSIAKEYGLSVIEDAAQAIGSAIGEKRAGSIGNMGCFSFFPSKNLGAFGDGGIVTTDSDDLVSELKILRVHGSHPKYYHRVIGGNFRLDALQAAIVSIKLKHLDNWTAARQENARTYGELFVQKGLADFVQCPVEKHTRHIYNQYVIRVSKKRDELRHFLQDEGVGTEVYYPLPLHLQECFSDLGYKKGDFPEAERAAGQTVALPVYSELTEAQQIYVVDKIKAFSQLSGSI